jgi:hypothetical protein
MHATKGFGTVFAIAAIALFALPAAAGAAVLHNQNSGGTGPGFFSQTDVDSDDFTELADDFVVPNGQTWTIRGIDVTGVYDGVGFGGPVTGINVRFYSNSGANLPGTELFSQLGIVPANGLAGPSFSLAIGGAPALTPGRYWLSVQAEGVNLPDQIWDWKDRTPRVGRPAASRTNFGFCGAAPNWVSRSGAGCATNSDLPDQMFSLSDTAPPSTLPVTPPVTPPAVGPPGNPTSPVNPAGNIRKRKCKKKQKAGAEIAKKKKCKKKK